MTRAAVPESVIRHGASSRLPGGGPVARRSPRRVPAAAWSWCAASTAVVAAAVVLVALTASGRLDPGVAVAVGLGLTVGGVLVVSWSVGAVREAWRDRPRDDVRVHASGTTVSLRPGPVPGDPRALAVVEVGGEPAGVLRERPARGRLGARRTLALAGRLHTLRRTDGHGDLAPVLSVRDPAGRVVAEAARFACPRRGRVVDWRLTVADRDLWLRAHRGRAPRRRTLLDDRGQAWVSRPRRGGREAGVPGATTVLPAELGSWDAAAAAWLLAEIEHDTTVITTAFLGDDDPGESWFDDPGSGDGGSGDGGSGDGGSGDGGSGDGGSGDGGSGDGGDSGGDSSDDSGGDGWW